MPARKKSKRGSNLAKLNQVHPKDLPDDPGAASAAPRDLVVTLTLTLALTLTLTLTLTLIGRGQEVRTAPLQLLARGPAQRGADRAQPVSPRAA